MQFALKMQRNKRYLLAGVELQCGDVIEIWYNRRWVRVRIELLCGEYYGLQVDTGGGYMLRNGLVARHPSEATT